VINKKREAKINLLLKNILLDSELKKEANVKVLL